MWECQLSWRFCLLASACLSTTACSSNSIEANAKEAAAPTIPVVAVAQAAPAPLSRDLAISGEFRPYQAVDVHAKVAGYLKEIRVDVGSRVSAGQTLATLEVPEMRDDAAQAVAARNRTNAEVQRARQELEQAQAGLNIAKLSADRLTAVNKREPGLIAQQELDEANARRQSADAHVAAAKANLQAALDQVEGAKAAEQRTRTMNDYSRIVAPFSGVVTKRYADTGAMIQAGTASQSQAMPLVRIAQVDRLRLVLPVPESAVPQLKPGRPVEVKVPAIGKTFHGAVARSSSEVQLATRTMDVEVDVPNSTGELVPGMIAEVMLTLDQRSDALAIPPQAVTLRDGKRYVLRVAPGGALEERQIELGIEQANKVEVRHGLSAGDMVVIGNRSQLKPGQKVEAKVAQVG